MRPTELEARVERERAAHTDDDVLMHSTKLKTRFAHVWLTPGYREMEQRRRAFISGLKGAVVLDYGCGRGELATEYLRAGANHVTGIDISNVYVADASRACTLAGFESNRFAFEVMDAHSLSYADASFDVVIGSGILHHLDLGVAVNEIKRVLRPNGQALFLEPLADNPLLRLFRLLTPKARTTDEHPLTRSDLSLISAAMESDSFYFGLLSSPTAMLTSVVIPQRPNNRMIRLADRIERSLQSKAWLSSWNQYALLVLRRP